MINSVNIRRLVKNRIFCLVLAILIIAQGLCGCGKVKNSDKENTNSEVVITLFAAKSLNSVMDEIICIYTEKNPNVKVQTNYDSSGTLMTQIVEGGVCDVFFSASPKQVDTLEDEGLTIPGTRNDLLHNQMCVVTGNGSGTEVTGLKDMYKAKSLAIAGQSVPIGNYTRRALVNLGILEERADGAEITSKDISAALGNVEINECANVGAVVAAVVEHSNEVGTVYYSDIAGQESSLQILEIVPVDITGEIIYPVVQVQNKEANESQSTEAAAFIEFLKSAEAKVVFERYHFITE